MVCIDAVFHYVDEFRLGQGVQSEPVQAVILTAQAVEGSCFVTGQRAGTNSGHPHFGACAGQFINAYQSIGLGNAVEEPVFCVVCQVGRGNFQSTDILKACFQILVLDIQRPVRCDHEDFAVYIGGSLHIANGAGLLSKIVGLIICAGIPIEQQPFPAPESAEFCYYFLVTKDFSHGYVIDCGVRCIIVNHSPQLRPGKVA